jgi:molybdopterin molybdotransferase
LWRVAQGHTLIPDDVAPSQYGLPAGLMPAFHRCSRKGRPVAAGFQALIPLDEAWARLQRALHDAHAGPRATEALATEQALGRVLAADITSTVDVPPHDNSAMDGYALRLADVPQVGDSLPQGQRIAAGQVGARLQPGTCARIFTGAPIPQGADAVVMQEHTTTAAGGRVQFTQPVHAGQNIRAQGEDIAVGQTVLHAGCRLSPASLGVAASVGLAQLSVWQRPRVAVLTTGDELVPPGLPLPPGAIYNSNRHTLLGLAQAAGAQASDLGIVPDQLDATRAALRQAAEHHDLIITSGGVSVGEEDHLRAAVIAEGELDFWALAIKPGKPFVWGRVRRADGSHALYMGLPGNPVASFVTFLLLARPVLGVLAGEGWHLPRPWRLPAAFTWPRADKRREFLRAQVDADGALALHPHQGSGVLSSAAWADGLIDLAPGQTVQPGDVLPFWPMTELCTPSAAARSTGRPTHQQAT